MADRFEDLRTFVAAFDAGGINAAAAELGIAKSAVSKRLSDLERRLGVDLIDRSARRFQTTALGAEYARRSRAILSSLDELDTGLSRATDVREVVIQAPAPIITHVLTPALPALEAIRERLAIRFVLPGSERACDVAVDEAARTAGEGREILSSMLVICGSPGYLASNGRPQEVRDLVGHSSIAIGDAPSEWRLGDRRRAAPAAAVTTTDMDAAAAAAVAGLGLVQLPDYLVTAALADGRLERVLTRHDPPPIAIHASAEQGAQLEVRRLVDALANAVGRGGSDRSAAPGQGGRGAG